MLSVPYEQRYVQKLLTKAETEADSPNRRPIAVHVVKPTYPESLRLTATEGEVTVRFTVDPLGRVVNPEVMKASHPLFGDRAIEAVQQWRFRPGKRDGINVSVRMQVPLSFRPTEGDLAGVDGMIGYARYQAKLLGPAAVEDAVDLTVAVPLKPHPYPRMPDNSLLPDGATALLMLVINAEGLPQRGHILQAKPEAVGPVLLSDAMAQRYRPRVIEGQVVSSSVLVPIRISLSGENPNVFRTP